MGGFIRPIPTATAGEIMEKERKRFLVTGNYIDIIYARDEEEAKEIYLEMNEKLNRTEPFDEIIVKENPFK